MSDDQNISRSKVPQHIKTSRHISLVENNFTSSKSGLPISGEMDSFGCEIMIHESSMPEFEG